MFDNFYLYFKIIHKHDKYSYNLHYNKTKSTIFIVFKYKLAFIIKINRKKND